MEDDEDCYGFGALSDMFDNRPATSGSTGAGASAVAAMGSQPKRLDVAAMSRFWWSERRLGEFQRGTQHHSKEFHHIAAKLDGMRVDGGLGSAFVVPPVRSDSSGRLEEGGVLWIQAQASDSNALAKRKKEFQDITNRRDALKTPKGSSKSTATVFLSSSEIIEAKETTVQHTVQGIVFRLRSGHQFELTFMPGPFHDARNRNEMLRKIRRLQSGELSSPETSPASTRNTRPAASLATSTVLGRSSRISSPGASSTHSGSRSHTPHSSPGDASSMSMTPPTPVPSNEECRAWVRRYIQLDETSTEAIALAKKINSSTNYQIGPLARSFPQFSADSAYRKKTVDGLSRTLERMNRDWRISEEERLMYTRAGCSRDENDMFQYKDTATNEEISPQSYQQRYMKYVEDPNPVIRLFEPRLQSASPSANLVVSSSDKPPSPSTTVDTTEHGDPISLFGIDLRRSCVVDSDFMVAWTSTAGASDLDMHDWERLLDIEVVQVVRREFVSRVAQKLSEFEELRSSMNDRLDSSPSTNTRRRSGNRRRSLDQPSLADLRSQMSVPLSTSSHDSDSDLSSSWKRQRYDEAVNQAVPNGRRRRRQSLVGTLDISLEEEKEEKEEAMLVSSGDQLVQPLDDTCPLCCDADAVVVMKPCGHSVCRACWNRLTKADVVSLENSEARQCPWDREAVTER